MDTANIESIVTKLRDEETRLNRKREAIQQGLNTVESELTRVQAGIAALTGGSSSKSGKGRSLKPSPTKDVVRSAVEAVWRNDGQLETEKLKQAVGSQLADEGYSRVGLSLRLKEVLQESRGDQTTTMESEQTIPS